MVATAHALIGGAMAASISNPALGVTLSAISHPLMDLIPHWDFARGWQHKPKVKLFIESSLDVIVGVILAYLFFSQGVEPRYFAACVLASIMWDFLEAPYWFLKRKIPPFYWAYQIQHRMQGRTGPKWGILTQLVTVIIIVFVLSRF